MNSTEQQLRERKVLSAFDQLGLGDPAHAGGPMLDSVRERMESRRRNRRQRRTALGLLAVTALAALGGRLAMADSDGRQVALDRPRTAPPVGSPEAGDLTLTALAMSGSLDTFRVECRQEKDLDGRSFELIRARGRTADSSATTLLFQAELAKLTPGARFELPIDESAAVVPTAFLLFASMSDGETALEASSTAETSGGIVEVVSASCGAHPALELAINASLGAEVAGRSAIEVAGTLAARG